MTASSSEGSEKMNILILSDSLAPLMASKIGRAESSGKTITERDMVSSFITCGDSFLQAPIAYDKQAHVKLQPSPAPFRTGCDEVRHRSRSARSVRRANRSRLPLPR